MNRRVCLYCEKELHADASEAIHLKVCEVYKQMSRKEKKNHIAELTEDDKAMVYPFCKLQWLPHPIQKHVQSCPEKYFQCDLCCEKILEKDRNKHHFLQCKMLQDKISSDLYECPLCGEYLLEKDKSVHESFACKTLIQIDVARPLYSLHEKTSKKYAKETEKVKPKVGKCPYCKTILNENILLFHQKECVYQPFECPDCSATILLKDSNSHFCKSAEEDIEISEIDLLSEHLKELFTNENCWDTVLQVEGKEFKAHRAILSARSSVFSAMFLHDTSEKQTGIVKIPDCDPDCFKELLEYLYSGKLKNISSDNAAQLYTISDKYNVQELKTFCVKYLMQNITLQNFSEVLILADDHDETNFLSAIQDFFNKHFKEIVVTNEWENLLKCNFRLANKLLIGKSKTE